MEVTLFTCHRCRRLIALLTTELVINVSFEKKFNSVTQKPVSAFDPTMKKASYLAEGLKRGAYFETARQAARLMVWLLKEKSLKNHGIHFIEEGLSDRNTNDFKTYQYHLTKYNLLDKKIFLKIDIEGAEYDAMKEAGFFTNMDNVIQFVAEFHYLKDHFQVMADIFKKLQPTHSLIHLHGNNNGGVFNYEGKNIPEVLEVVFLHNSFVPEKEIFGENVSRKRIGFPLQLEAERYSARLFCLMIYFGALSFCLLFIKKTVHANSITNPLHRSAAKNFFSAYAPAASNCNGHRAGGRYLLFYSQRHQFAHRNYGALDCFCFNLSYAQRYRFI